MKPHSHLPEAIRERISSDQEQSYLRDWIYGGIDGAVTTFAIVAGVAGAKLADSVVLILGLANLVADGFSMAASNYLGTQAEKDQLARIEKHEYESILKHPEGEREEVRQIMAQKGLRGDLLEDTVRVLTSEPRKWVRLMLTEEYGLPTSIRSPIKAGWATFASFIICGSVPLLSYLLSREEKFLWATGFTGLTFFVIGSIKSRWTGALWWQSGLKTLFVGICAAGLAYLVGALLRAHS